MPAPVLRRHSRTVAAANTVETVVPSVSTARALVIGKLTVVTSTATTFSLLIGGVHIVRDMALALGEQYVETNLIVPAGEALTVSAANAGAVVVQAFGEEVDN
jgi:hypothetical protein